MVKLPFLSKALTTKSRADQLLSCKYPHDIAQLLDVPENRLALLSANPLYYTFTVPKRDGSKRNIEAPYSELMQVLRQLNEYLQSVYWFCKTESAYGYVIGTKNSKGNRSIITNAQKHLGNTYMLNADFEDFFHQITQSKIEEILGNQPFHLHEDTVSLLAGLICYRGRLPMGSPTSPVLSNFACIGLDNELTEWTKRNNIIFTRFVDDLTFSSNNPIAAADFESIKQIVAKHDLFFNPEKTKWYGAADNKIVTGLEVTDKINIPGSFYYELSQDLERLKHTVEASYLMHGSIEGNAMVKKYCEQVAGKINFIGMVLGTDHGKYNDYANRYAEALNPEIDPHAIRWMDLPYHV